jgi:uncharacterized flavoprotein (TIGR03862 family)
MSPQKTLNVDVAVIGAGPAGLMAAEVLSAAGVSVHVFDAMPSVGRKFLLAGKGGLNMTHAEALDAFIDRFGPQSAEVGAWLTAWGPDAVRAWAHGLGIETFVGSSHRVFPTDMKAAPLLRAWLQRLRHPSAGGVPVQFHMRHRCVGCRGEGAEGHWAFEHGDAEVHVHTRATVLALGGASWSRLGSDGAWARWAGELGVAVAPLQPANVGFEVAGTPAHADAGWSPWLVERFAGQPLKTVALHAPDLSGAVVQRRGEMVITEHGIEGSLVYALGAGIREALHRGQLTVHLDLLPDWRAEDVWAQVCHPRGSRSLSSHLKSRLRLDGLKSALLNECLSADERQDPQRLAQALKRLPLRLVRPRPIDEAISTAGGVRLDSLTPDLMSRQHPGVFWAGEMLDWEAPTGGYLLTAAWASGVVAGQGAVRWLGEKR